MAATSTPPVGPGAKAAVSWASLQLFDRDARGWREGLLAEVTKNVLEAALEAELEAHLGYARYEQIGRQRGSNSRNGSRRKTLRTCAGPVTVDVPRDRWATFAPVTVGKWQRRTAGLDHLVVPLAAHGSTPEEMAEQLAWVFRNTPAAPLLDRMAACVRDRLEPWHGRPVAHRHAVILLDRVVVRSRRLGIAAPPVHTAVAVTTEGQRELLGLWRGQPAAAVERWLEVAQALRARGAADVDAVVLDPASAAAAAVSRVWPSAQVYVRGHGEPGSGSGEGTAA